MSAEEMETLLSFVGPDLTKQTTNYRTPNRVEAKTSCHSKVSYWKKLYCVSRCMEKSSCIMETCEAIERKMLFHEKWDDPQTTKLGEPFCFYYKGTFSLVILALLDANYRFTAIQVGDFGRNSDGGVYVPQDAFLPGSEDLGTIPYTMVGDAAFPLKPHLMRPYAGNNISYEKEMFNYRLCRARMTVEKAFGILAARWRILYQKINLLPSKVDTLVVVMCILHNFLTKPCDVEMWLQQGGAGMRRGIAIQANRAGQEAVSVREKFTQYFTSVEGRIEVSYWKRCNILQGQPTPSSPSGN
uniref:DDE Tnp4 domain-containing protein n=1 Tax=Salmo trutta TaxID=8032 RepID=A0A674DMB6_SALTR